MSALKIKKCRKKGRLTDPFPVKNNIRRQRKTVKKISSRNRNRERDHSRNRIEGLKLRQAFRFYKGRTTAR